MVSFHDATAGSGRTTAAHFASDCEYQVSAEPHGVIFRAGEKKNCVFRIESGAVELEWFLGDGSSGCIERLGPGQIFGVGFLDHHIANAVVVEPSRISIWRRQDLTPGFRDVPGMQERETIETTREFEHRKALILSSRSKEVSRRIAGFLCLAAQFNARDGRDPYLIDEAVDGAQKLVIVLGAEGPGIRPAVAKACAELARIPIAPQMESLNVSNAAAVAFYESSRKRFPQ